MKKLCIIFVLLALCMCACKKAEEPAQPEKLPDTTEPRQTENAETTDPFEYESEIDFSDLFGDPTQPEETEDEAEQTTAPEESDPAVQEPTQTDPPETEPIPTEPIPTEPDGYQSAIIRP